MKRCMIIIVNKNKGLVFTEISERVNLVTHESCDLAFVTAKRFLQPCKVSYHIKSYIFMS